MSVATARGTNDDEVIVISSAEPPRRSPTTLAGGSSNPVPIPGGGAADNEPEVIDLTGSPEVEILSSTVRPAPPRKRPRISPTKQAFLKVRAAHQAAAARVLPAAPDEPPSPKGPKCGICLESMGGSSGKQMWAGSCGHVYCKDCLLEAVKATKKCPTCRKNLQQRQLHQVFLSF